MNKQTHHQLVKEAVSKKFRGSQPLKSKVIPRYPDSCERELQRIARGYTKMFYAILKDHLPEMMSAYKKERHGDSRFDDTMDLDREIRQQFAAIAQELERKVSQHGLEELVEKAGKLTKNASVREWKRVIRNTLGVDLMDDYYNGEAYDRALRKWIDENVLKSRAYRMRLSMRCKASFERDTKTAER